MFVCATCQKSEEKMSHCARCQVACYCSKQCQVKDWSNHKRLCTRMGESKDMLRLFTTHVQAHPSLIDLVQDATCLLDLDNMILVRLYREGQNHIIIRHDGQTYMQSQSRVKIGDVKMFTFDQYEEDELARNAHSLGHLYNDILRLFHPCEFTCFYGDREYPVTLEMHNCIPVGRIDDGTYTIYNFGGHPFRHVDDPKQVQYQGKRVINPIAFYWSSKEGLRAHLRDTVLRDAPTTATEIRIQQSLYVSVYKELMKEFGKEFNTDMIPPLLISSKQHLFPDEERKGFISAILSFFNKRATTIKQMREIGGMYALTRESAYSYIACDLEQYLRTYIKTMHPSLVSFL